MPKAKKVILVDEKTINRREVAIAKEIKKTYFPTGKIPEEINLFLLCILKGGAPFASAIQRELYRLGINVPIEYLPAGSYGNGTTSSGRVQFKVDKKLAAKLKGKDVLLIEDIVDTGTTLSQLTEFLQKNVKLNSLRIAVEFDKPSRRIATVQVDFIGFEIPDAWVEGRGIDTAGLGRGNPNLVEVIFET